MSLSTISDVQRYANEIADRIRHVVETYPGLDPLEAFRVGALVELHKFKEQLPVLTSVYLAELCANCNRWEDEHATMKCLFEASTFKASGPLPPNHFEITKYEINFVEIGRKLTFIISR